MLLLNAHFDCHASHAQWHTTMDSLLTCAHHVRASVTIIQGDLSSDNDGAAPLAVTLRREPPLQHYVRVLPPRTPTNVVSVQERIRATAIDHLFVNGPVHSSEHHLVPTASSHLAVIAEISLTSTRYALFEWKHLRWRLAPQRLWTLYGRSPARSGATRLPPQPPRTRLLRPCTTWLASACQRSCQIASTSGAWRATNCPTMTPCSKRGQRSTDSEHTIFTPTAYGLP